MADPGEGGTRDVPPASPISFIYMDSAWWAFWLKLIGLFHRKQGYWWYLARINRKQKITELTNRIIQKIFNIFVSSETDQ